MMNKIIASIAIVLSLISIDVSAGYYGRGRPSGGGYHGRPGGGRPGYNPGHRPNGGFHGHGNGYIGRPVRFYAGPVPRGGWRGSRYYYEGHSYYMWTWGPYAPFYNWEYYNGWRLGLYYYIPEGLKCFADNPAVPGEWVGQTTYYHSDDAINSALGLCESDPQVQGQNAQDQCRIRNCVRW